MGKQSGAIDWLVLSVGHAHRRIASLGIIEVELDPSWNSYYLCTLTSLKCLLFCLYLASIATQNMNFLDHKVYKYLIYKYFIPKFSSFCPIFTRILPKTYVMINVRKKI